MKTCVLAVLVLFVLSNVVFASTYGKPYGSDDTNATEKSDVKSIDQINRATEIVPEEPQAETEQPVEIESEQAPAEDLQEPVPEEGTVPPEEQEKIIQ